LLFQYSFQLLTTSADISEIFSQSDNFCCLFYQFRRFGANNTIYLNLLIGDQYFGTLSAAGKTTLDNL
jgi:hypothetical protein